MFVTKSPLKILSSQAWNEINFFTYALSLSFFESVILDRLVRTGSGNPTIYADPFGITSAISEYGALRVGLDYDLIAVSVKNGVFHPKIVVMEGTETTELLIGSGNLTFGGWGVNLECWSHVLLNEHPQIALELIGFLKTLNNDKLIEISSKQNLSDLQQRLTKTKFKSVEHTNLKLVHNIDRSISEEIANACTQLGGANRILCAAPFYDHDGSNLINLAKKIGLKRVNIHVHGFGTVGEKTGVFWPQTSDNFVSPCSIDFGKIDVHRKLHMKMIEIVCHKGRIVMAGSANPTQKGLLSNGNVEVSLLHIYKNGKIKIKACEAPKQKSVEQSFDEDLETQPFKILSATFENNQLTGQVLGISKLQIVSAEIDMLSEQISIVGDIQIDSAGFFEICNIQEENKFWQAGRKVLVLSHSGQSNSKRFHIVSRIRSIKKCIWEVSPKLSSSAFRC